MEKKPKITSIQIGDQEINMEGIEPVEIEGIVSGHLPSVDDLNKVLGRVNDPRPKPPVFMELEVVQYKDEKAQIFIRAHSSFEIDHAILVFEECLSEMKKHKENGFKFVNEIE